MSDLHLEFGKMSKDDFEPADVLILAGDIDVWGREGTKMFEWMETLPFPYIIFTPGNHEFYHCGNICRDYKEMQMEVLKYPKIHLLLEGKINILGQTFIGTPLWSNFGNDENVIRQASRCINDFNKTTYDGTIMWTPDQMALEFNKSFAFLDNSISGMGTEVVVTHWAPSHQSGDSQYVGDSLNPYFTNNLDRFISTNGPKVWIHGHCHNSSDYMIGETRILCNPRGYVGHELNEDFDITKSFEI